jgi:hypothetical protein
MARMQIGLIPALPESIQQQCTQWEEGRNLVIAAVAAAFRWLLLLLSSQHRPPQGGEVKTQSPEKSTQLWLNTPPHHSCKPKKYQRKDYRLLPREYTQPQLVVTLTMIPVYFISFCASQVECYRSSADGSIGRRRKIVDIRSGL